MNGYTGMLSFELNELNFLIKRVSIMKTCPKCKSNMIIDIIYDGISSTRYS